MRFPRVMVRQMRGARFTFRKDLIDVRPRPSMRKNQSLHLKKALVLALDTRGPRGDSFTTAG
jgi:hypothetical protein